MGGVAVVGLRVVGPLGVVMLVARSVGVRGEGVVRWVGTLSASRVLRPADN
jgi:hypothetical protein